jgi:aldose 1-epimerase
MVLRSGMLTALVLAVLLGGLILIVRERGRGHLAKLERELQPKTVPQGPVMPPLGGQDAVVLARSASAGATSVMPEFVSATMLPGQGMNVLQIMANVPSLGKISLLDSPSLDDAAKILNGTGSDAQGMASLAMGGALEVPWANRMGGVPTPDGESVMAVWEGQTMVLPAAPQTAGDGAPTAVGGLMLKRQSNTVETHVVPDGWQSHVVYEAGGFDGHWLSTTEVTTQVLLNSRVMEIAVTATNTGTVAEPVGIGWRPHFAIPGGDRANTVLRLPEGLEMEMRPAESPVRGGLPSGRLVPMTGLAQEFTKPAGAKLSDMGLDASFVHLKQGYMDSGPVVELRDLKDRFGLRITLLTPTIRALRVNAPADKAMVEIDPQFNYDDPFGNEWAKDEDTGMETLQSGQSTQWKVRLELFPLAMDTGGAGKASF